MIHFVFGIISDFRGFLYLHADREICLFAVSVIGDPQITGAELIFGSLHDLFNILGKIQLDDSLFAIAMNIVPAVSARKALNDEDGIRRESNTGLRYAFLIGFPCTVGLSLLSRQAVAFFYEGTFLAEKLKLSSDLLTWQSITIVLFTVVQAASGILQGIRRQKIPMYAMIIGVSLKILLNYILIGTPGINIFGGPIASIVCYSVAMLITLFYSCRYAKLRFNWMDWIVRPGVSSAIMGITVYALRCLLPGGRLSTIIEIFAGIVVFIAAAIVLKAISLDELKKMLKRGKK